MATSSDATPSTTGRVLHWAGRYDLLVWLFTRGRDRTFRETLVRLARLAPGEHVLDVGCGTGSLAIAVKRFVGGSGEVFGIDPSPEMITRATSKARKTSVDIQFKSGVAESLPFPDAQFDVVLSSLMLHHLPRKLRQRFVQEVRRVLKPTGRVLIADFGEAQDRVGFLAHFHRHGHVNPREVVALLSEARLRFVESGAVGVGSLQYVLAEAEE